MRLIALCLLIVCANTWMANASQLDSLVIRNNQAVVSDTVDVVKPDTIKYWKKKWNIGVNGSQASFSNWSQGNTNSIAATGTNLLNLNYKKDKYAYDLLMNFRYGQTRINGHEVRKTDDLINIKNRVDHLLHAQEVSAYFEVDFRTQFDKGRDKNGVYISNFMSPGYILETAGLGYKPYDFIQFQSGLTFKQTIMSDTTLSKRYGLKSESSFRGEGGFSLGATFKKSIAKNLVLNSNVTSFTNFLQNIEHTDIMFSNELTGKINSFMNTNIQFVLMYDKDYNKQVQLKQVLAVGLSFNVF